MEGTSICLLTMERPEVFRIQMNSLLSSLEPPFEVIVVDNGSKSEEKHKLLDVCENDYGWKVFRIKRNLGLSLGTNHSLGKGKFNFLIHLDDDCIIKQEGWNQILRNHAFQDNEIGLVVPFHGQEFILHNKGKVEEFKEIRWGLGMVWGIKKQLFDSIGGYDPQLMHQNECDLAMRVRMSGHYVAGFSGFHATHLQEAGERTELSLAREHLGVVQFRDKWTSYFRGLGWNYGTLPLYLMQHWPPDQDFYYRFSRQNGVDLNPPPEGSNIKTSPGEVLGMTEQTSSQIPRRIKIKDGWYCIVCELRNDYSYCEREGTGYLDDRMRAIEKWFNLTGQKYSGYIWEQLPYAIS